MVASCLSIVSLYDSFLRRSVAAAGLSSQTIDIDGDTTIHFWGPPFATSKPPLILIQGFGPPGIWQWRPQINFFAGEFDLYVPDLLFFGGSSSKSGDRSEVFQASCLAKLLQYLGIHRYSVLGTSYGGFVAYRLAAMWPERVERVVIASSAVNMRPHDNSVLLRKANAEKIEDVLLPATAAELRRLLGFCLHRRPYIPDFILTDFIDKLYSDYQKEKLELLEGLTIGRDETPRISPLPQDVLIVWGEHDQIFFIRESHRTQEISGGEYNIRSYWKRITRSST